MLFVVPHDLPRQSTSGRLYCLVLMMALERHVWKRDKWRTPIKRQAYYLGMNGEAK